MKMGRVLKYTLIFLFLFSSIGIISAATFSDSSFEDSTITVWNPQTGNDGYGGGSSASRTTGSYDSSHCLYMSGFGTGYYNEGAADAWGWSSVYQNIDLTGMGKISYYTKGSYTTGSGASQYARIYFDDNASNYLSIPIYASWTAVTQDLPAGLTAVHAVKIKVYGFGSGNYDSTGQRIVYLDDITLSSSVTAPVSNFSGSPTSGSTPLSVSFTDTSTGSPTSWSWDLGDGNTSSSQNPSHTYYSPGTYTVTLTATNAGGSDPEVKTNYISVGSISSNTTGSNFPSANFHGVPRFGLIPLTVQFYNDGSGYTASLWDFFDGNTSSSANPSHTFYTPGTYYISLNNSNVSGSNKLTIFNYIIAYPPVTSAFSANQTSIRAGDYVLFTDSSTGSSDTWIWCINGAQVSTATNLIYQFPSAGTFSIQHYAANSLDSSFDWENKTNFITVAGAAPNCDFAANVTYGNAPLDVLLTDTSTGTPSSWTWGINGVYQTNTQDMTVTFNEPGIYSINHTATNAIGSDSEAKTNFIQVYAPNYGGIYGYIVDADKNTTISGASCQMTNSTATANIVSDSTGFYYFWPVWNGVYNLSVSKNGYAIASFPNTIINGTTIRQDIYLTSYSDNVNETNISNYTSDWLRYNLVSDPSTKTITLTYSVIKGTTAYANCTIYDESIPVFTSNITSQTNTFSFTGSPNKNYLVSFDIINSEGNRFSGAFPILFYRGFPGNNPIFPPGTPQGIINGIIVFVIIACFAFFGKAYLEIGMFMGLGVMVSSYIWGFLNLPDTIHIEVIIFLTALIAGGAYITKKRILGW